MARLTASPPHLVFGKWCVYGLALLAPGSFFVLPAYWLFRRWHTASQPAPRRPPQEDKAALLPEPD